MNPEGERDTDWLAFQYITGELNEDQASAFEQRLEHDQKAREAVASAVELVDAVALVSKEVPSVGVSRPRHWSIAAAWASVAVALVVGALLWEQPDHVPALTPDAEVSSETSLSNLAMSWQRVRDEAKEEGLDLTLEEEEFCPPVEEFELVPELAVPSWLLTATALPALPEESTQ